MKKGQFLLLGCSVSSGVPAVGNDWGKCDPNEPKNRRDRPCAVVRTENTTLIVDTGSDFRAQMNAINLAEFDAVLYTHAHSDHIMGIDELRIVRIRMKQLIDIYGDRDTIEVLQKRFDYLFEDQDFYQKVLTPHVIGTDTYGQERRIDDIPFTPFAQDHGGCPCIGYRFGNLGYSADMRDLDDEAVETLKGIDIWIADGAGHHIADHPTHAPLTTLYRLNEQIKARKVYVTGLSKFMDYNTLKKELPENFEPAWDGLDLTIEF